MGSDQRRKALGARADMTGIRFPIKTPRLTIRPMRLDDAAFPAVYGDVETMQHLNSELATVDEVSANGCKPRSTSSNETTS